MEAEFAEALSLFKEITSEDEEQKPEPEPELCCGQEGVYVQGFRTCETCGYGTEEMVLLRDRGWGILKQRACYKRVTYFTNLILLISCKKACFSPMFPKVVEQLQHEEFKSISELRQILKRMKVPRLYPAIFLLFRDVKDRILVPLTNPQIRQLTVLFMKFEQHLRRKKREQFFSHHLLINRFMKRLTIPNYQQVLVPVSNRKKVSVVDNILSAMGI